jgi:hypothetical protein
MQLFDENNMGDILCTQYMFKGFNKEGIQEVINGLSPETCIVNLYSQHHGKTLADEISEGSCSEDESDCETESDEDSDNGIEYQKERWYGAKYTKEKIPQNLLDIMRDPEVSED